MKKPLPVVVYMCIVLGSGACTEGGPATGGGAAPAPLPSLLGADAEAGFARARAPRTFSFPADHGPHEGYRNEWWYFTGNLESAGGRRFGYELTLFRFRLVPGARARLPSRWDTAHVLVGHFAVTDAEAGAFHAAERYAREAAGLAGATAGPAQVWLYDWSIRRPVDRDADQAAWQLVASHEDIGIALTLVPEKAPVLHGEGGLSRKSAAADTASYYYSVPRLATTGLVSLHGESFDVRGSSWLDREWSSSALAADQAGWDWFSLQLADGSDLMFYQLRGQDGRRDPASAGTWMPAGAPPEALAADDVTIEVLEYWDSPAGGRYPIDWRLGVPRLHLHLRIRPVLENQELSTIVRYWEGAVDVTGTRGTRRVTGRGYVEMTGYAGS